MREHTTHTHTHTHNVIYIMHYIIYICGETRIIKHYKPFKLVNDAP